MKARHVFTHTKTWRVRNDRLGDEGTHRHQVRLDTRVPAAVQDLRDHLPLLLDVARPQALHAREQPRVLDHVRHQLCRVAADRIEL